MIDEIAEQLRVHEGLICHAYKDHLGYWTIGYGRLIDERRGGGITKEEAEMLLQNDIRNRIDRLNNAIPGFGSYPVCVQKALVNMAFQLGMDGLLNFKKMIAALENGDYVKAAEEGLDSRWAQQTPNRAKEVTDMIREGDNYV